MQKIIIQRLTLLILSGTFIIWGCTKLDTTNIGLDLIPGVDNINTFADTLSINTSQGIFNDSTLIGVNDDHVLGSINNDPLFGTTKANIYLQVKPPFYPFKYGNTGDTLNGFGAGFDSVVLCLGYRGYWGDNTVLQDLIVKEIADQEFSDSSQKTRKISYQPNTASPILGSKTLDIRTLSNFIKISTGRDSVNNQIRIKLSNTWGAGLFLNDTSTVNPLLNDSAFRRIYHGLAIIANGSGNALMYNTLNDVNTRLEVHYRKRSQGKIDTIFSSFRIVPANTGSVKKSASASNITRNRSGYPVSSPSTNEIYLQTTPGTYANLSIPGISSLTNRVIHRAEIFIEQIPSNSFFDTTFRAPDFLYLDLIDTATSGTRWKPIYYDLNPNVFYNPDLASFFFPNEINFVYYGAFRKNKIDQFGNNISYYNINITRHLQQIVTKNTPNYSFRLAAPFQIYYPQYSIPGFTILPITYNNRIALGRVKVGSGTNPNYRMKLRIVYSKI